MNAAKLRELIKDWPDHAAVIVRTIEQGEVCLTVSLTSVDQYEDGSVLLVGDLDRAGN